MPRGIGYGTLGDLATLPMGGRRQINPYDPGLGLDPGRARIMPIGMPGRVGPRGFNRGQVTASPYQRPMFDPRRAQRGFPGPMPPGQIMGPQMPTAGEDPASQFQNAMDYYRRILAARYANPGALESGPGGYVDLGGSRRQVNPYEDPSTIPEYGSTTPNMGYRGR